MRRLTILATASMLAAIPALAQLTPTLRTGPVATGEIKPKFNPPVIAAPPFRPQPTPTPTPAPVDMAAMAASLAGIMGAPPGPITTQAVVGPGALNVNGAQFAAYDADIGVSTFNDGSQSPYLMLKGSNAQWRIDFRSTGKPYAIDCAIAGGSMIVNFEYGGFQMYTNLPAPIGTGSVSLSNGHALIAIPPVEPGRKLYVRYWANVGGSVQLTSCNLMSLG